MKMHIEIDCTPEEARHWVEYCNSPAGTQQADLTRKRWAYQYYAAAPAPKAP